MLPGILFSCVSSKELNRVSPEQFAPFSTENFNGKYNNCTDSAAFSLLDVLENKSLLFAEKSSDCQAAILELYFDGRHKLHIKQILDEKVVFETTVRVKQKKNYLSLKRKLLLIPIPAVFYWHDERKAIIGLTDKGELLIKQGSENFGWLFLFLHGGNSSHTAARFKKN